MDAWAGPRGGGGVSARRVPPRGRGAASARRRIGAVDGSLVRSIAKEEHSAAASSVRRRVGASLRRDEAGDPRDRPEMLQLKILQGHPNPELRFKMSEEFH